MLSDTEAAELNRRVAVAMGWTPWEEDDGPTGVWELPNGDPLRFDECAGGLPDFCRDPHALGWMVEWLDEKAKMGVPRGGDTCLRWDVEMRPKGSYFASIYGEFDCFDGGYTAGEALACVIVDYTEAEKEEPSEH